MIYKYVTAIYRKKSNSWPAWNKIQITLQDIILQQTAIISLMVPLSNRDFGLIFNNI